MCISLGISGLGWGTIGFVSYTYAFSHKELTLLLIASMTSGATVTYVSSRLAMACAIIPAISLLVLGYSLSNDEFNILIVGLMVLHGTLLLMAGKTLNKTITTSLTLDAELRKNEERLRMSMESSKSLTWDWDLLSDHFYWEGNTELFPEGQNQLRQFLKTSFDLTADLDTEYVIKRKDGSSHHIAVRGKLHRSSDGRAQRITGICWDITAKKTEEILRREKDLHEAANKAKSVFLANASHEIRTPLSAIIGFTEALLRNENVNEETRQDIHSIYRQGNYMVSLVNDLLDLSKIETNRLYIQKAPMSPVREVEDSISVIKKHLDEKRLDLELVYETLIPESVFSDSVRFRQVLINLLTNSIKFSHRGLISIRVSFYSDMEGMGFLSIRVSDKGMGITKATQENLFQPFVRGESPEVQKVQGSGLGLALSLSLMKMMGGDLKLVSSTIGQGSTFEMIVSAGPLQDLKLIRINKARSPITERSLLPKPDISLKGKKVLVVDDSVDLQLLMQRYLLREGADVATADNGAHAVELALRSPFDIILMDIKMPIMDGYKATAVLRENGYKHPIVALTAQASADGQQKSHEMGFDGYLSKPVNMGLLAEILRKFHDPQ